jgi:hypothetical protein
VPTGFIFFNSLILINKTDKKIFPEIRKSIKNIYSQQLENTEKFAALPSDGHCEIRDLPRRLKAVLPNFFDLLTVFGGKQKNRIIYR